jgi:predicted enzyme related to lactoylglutathione lyase
VELGLPHLRELVDRVPTLVGVRAVLGLLRAGGQRLVQPVAEALQRAPRRRTAGAQRGADGAVARAALQREDAGGRAERVRGDMGRAPGAAVGAAGAGAGSASCTRASALLTARPYQRTGAPGKGCCHVCRSRSVMPVVTTTTTTGGTTMLEKVFYTSVLVSDQDKALDFYTNVLGLEKRVENPTPDGPRFLTVGVKGDDFQLVLWPGTPGQAQPAMGRPPASITIETDDIRKTVDELKSRDVEFVSDVLEFPWGSVAQFQDPDGNRLQVREGRAGY